MNEELEQFNGFFLYAVSYIGSGNMAFLGVTVARNSQQAIDKILANSSNRNQFSVSQVEEFDFNRLYSLFKVAKSKEVPKQVLVFEVAEEPITEKSRLMQEVIEKQDQELFKKILPELTKSEAKLIEEKLTNI